MREYMVKEIESAIDESIDYGFINEPDPETRKEMISEIVDYISLNIDANKAAPRRFRYIPDYKSLVIDCAKNYGLLND